MLDSSIKLDFSTWNSYPAVIITAAVQQSPITCIFSCEVEDFDSRFFLEFFIQWERKTESYPPSTTRMPRIPIFPAQRSWRHLLLLTGRKWEIFPAESYGGTPGQSCEGRLSQEPQPSNLPTGGILVLCTLNPNKIWWLLRWHIPCTRVTNCPHCSRVSCCWKRALKLKRS